MQIVYLGFAGTSPLEAEAGVQLVRLERFSALLGGCHLAIEAIGDEGVDRRYDARLDLITRANELRPVEHCVDRDPQQAVRRAFAAAEQTLAAERDASAARARPTPL